MNVGYENVVLQAKFKELLATKMNVKNYLTIDNSLTENEGMTKRINTYTYTGKVENVAEGGKNTVRGSVGFVPSDYKVKVAQQVFDYTDENVMLDGNLVEGGLKGAAELMANELTSGYINTLKTATLVIDRQTGPTTSTFSFDLVVDAIAMMNIEDESGLFLVMGTKDMSAVRKSPEFKNKELGQIITNGAIGTICGVPVVHNRALPDGTSFLATKEAVTLFTKKDSEIEQHREPETRTNTVIMRTVNVMGLTDATKVVKILTKNPV